MPPFLLLGLAGLALAFMNNKNATRNTKGQVNAKGSTKTPAAANNQSNPSQPWYTQAKNFITAASAQEVQQIQKNPTAALQNFGSVIHSVSDFGGNVSSWFGTGSNSSGDAPNASSGTLADSPDDIPSNADNVTLPASEVDQSNAVGQVISDSIDQNSAPDGMDASTMDFSSDGSNSDLSLDAMGADNFPQ